MGTVEKSASQDGQRETKLVEEDVLRPAVPLAASFSPTATATIEEGQSSRSSVQHPSVAAVTWLKSQAAGALKLLRFVGPGFMVAVAYIDPGNYSTGVSAGAATRFALLFIILMSNLFALVLQTLAIRLGTVTGMNLAEHCREHLPCWLNWMLYFFAEAAIIATDIAEVIGSAISLNLLLNIPLVAGCAITIVEVLVILLFYRPNGSMRGLRVFEYFIVGLVLAVVVCFSIQLSLVHGVYVGEVFRGYLPSSTVVQGRGIYLSCGILGATVMPHSLYLGSGMCQPRLRQFDEQRLGRAIGPLAGSASPEDSTAEEKVQYRPSIEAIKHCLKTSTLELVLSLSVFALFVNSAILIVAGASLSSNADAANADLFGIYNLLSSSISKGAGTIFALALLFSGLSAGIVCTVAGQMVSEGAIRWTIKPWLRQLMTRSISITPSIIIAGAVGRDGLAVALNNTQVALSIILPFVSAPLVYFTCRNKYMTVGRTRMTDGTARRSSQDGIEDGDAVPGEPAIGMRNHWMLSVLAILVWLVIAIMNVALLVFVGLGES